MIEGGKEEMEVLGVGRWEFCVVRVVTRELAVHQLPGV